MADADVIVIGSGFGGAVSACRLAQAGASVLVLERGREWHTGNFPRSPADPWLWDDTAPADRSGWFDVRLFPHMAVVQGAGVGGGSLVYANIFIEPKPDTFASGWPPDLTYDVLGPHLAEAGRMLEVQKVPVNQWPERTRLLRDAAVAAGWQHRFRTLDMAVRFDPAWTYGQADPHAHATSRPQTNLHGVAQGTCVHLGECDLGCPVKARNTLDFNYLAVARAHGAVIKPLHRVREIRAVANGTFEVHAHEIGPGTMTPRTFTSRRVVLGAGSLGSTELLLRSKMIGGLPHVSARVGQGWSSNGDFLTPAIHPLRDVRPTRGPTITAAIDLLDGEYMGQPIFVEDGGLPDVARDELARRATDPDQGDLMALVTATLLPILSSIDLTRRVMPWFAQARDAADGRLSIRDGRLFLDWDIANSEAAINAVASVHRKLAMHSGGLPLTPLPWTLARDLVTPHPLGGCNMGVSADAGVVDSRGEVFGHPGLFVADGAVVPRAIGLNPSRTIAALAEHIVRQVIAGL